MRPKWEDKTEADWSTPNTVLPYSRIKDGTGISAGNTYEYKATINGAEHTGQFTTQAGNAMTDGSLETWRSDKQFPGSGTKYTFWEAVITRSPKTCAPATIPCPAESEAIAPN